EVAVQHRRPNSVRVAIGGARRLPKGTALKALALFIGRLAEQNPEGLNEVLLRQGISTSPGPFEEDVARLSYLMGVDVRWCIPKPTPANPGRQSVFVRDFDMVAEADLVLAFVAPDGDEYSGTAHLLDKAIELGKPVYAYEVADD